MYIWIFDYISKIYNWINYRNVWFKKVIIILIRRIEVLIFKIYSKNEPLPWGCCGLEKFYHSSANKKQINWRDGGEIIPYHRNNWISYITSPFFKKSRTSSSAKSLSSGKRPWRFHFLWLLVQQHSDQGSLKITEIDVTLTEELCRFIMSPVWWIFCGTLILDILQVKVYYMGYILAGINDSVIKNLLKEAIDNQHKIC